MSDGPDTLERFREAQRQRHGGFDTALAEIRAGAKRGHWIWYVFPQVAGLGSSAMSQAYAIRSPEEAAAYLEDPELGPRLVTITDAVREAVRAGAPLARVMGSEIDALKLVSSMTLFSGVARRQLSDASPAADALREMADEVLAAAERQGYPRCSVTDAWLAKE